MLDLFLWESISSSALLRGFQAVQVARVLSPKVVPRVPTEPVRTAQFFEISSLKNIYIILYSTNQRLIMPVGGKLVLKGGLKVTSTGVTTKKKKKQKKELTEEEKQQLEEQRKFSFELDYLFPKFLAS